MTFNPVARAAVARWLGVCALTAGMCLMSAGALAAGTAKYEYDALGRLRKVTHEDTSLTTYGIDAAGNRTNVSTEGPDILAPTFPGPVTFTLVDLTSARVNWPAATDSRGVAGYDVKIDAGQWTAVGVVTSYPLTGLAQATTYQIAVRARDEAGNSTERTGILTTATPEGPDTVPPSTPGTLSYIIGLTTVVANWGAATDNKGVVGYDYRYGRPGNLGAWTPVTNTQAVMNGLQDSTTYNIEVRARDAAGNISALPRTGSFNTASGSAPTQPGTPVANNLTANSALMRWGQSIDDLGVVGYEYTLDGWVTIGVITFGGPTGHISEKQLNGLTSGVSYTFAVRAFDGPGNRSAPSSGQFTTLDNVAPTTPPTLDVSEISPTTAVAVWGQSTDNLGVTGYEYRLNFAPSWSPAPTPGGVRRLDFTGLAPATNYTLEMRAVDQAGNASPSVTRTFATQSAPDVERPSAPGALQFAGIQQTNATVSWAASSDNVGVTGYDWRINSNQWQTIPGSQTAVNLAGLTAGTAYTVSVLARDATGNLSDITSALLTTAAPPAFSATVQVSGSAPVNLRALADAAGYNGAQNANVTFQVPAGTTLIGTVNGGIALDTGSWPTGSFTINLTLEIAGKVYGGGGNGGAGSASGNGLPGAAGGDAIYVRAPISIAVNGGGEIKAGGGGGGGASRRNLTSPVGATAGGDGGGGGFPNGSGANGSSGIVPGQPPGTPTDPAVSGAPGSISGGGAGGSGGNAGGGGGNAGTPGTNGAGGSPSFLGGAGGAAGFAIRRNGNPVPVSNNGTIVGTQG